MMSNGQYGKEKEMVSKFDHSIDYREEYVKVGRLTATAESVKCSNREI